jgi:ribonuclease BN (tRNA processing enzyme)
VGVKLTVIGCAPAYATRPDRSSSSYLVEHGDTAIVLDMGQGAFSELWRYRSPSKVAAVLISHMHADHNVDLIALRQWTRYGNRGYGPALFGPTDLRVRFSEFQMRYGEALPTLDFFADLKGGVLKEGSFAVGDLHVEARHVTHIPDSFAFRVTTGTGSGPGLVYSGDCGVPDDLLPLVKPGDVLVCEAGFGVKRDTAGIHLTAGEAASVAQRTQAGRLILTHVHDRARGEPILNAARESFSGDIKMAEPGLALDIR